MNGPKPGHITAMDKRALSERDICTNKFITPALRMRAGTKCCKFARRRVSKSQISCQHVQGHPPDPVYFMCNPAQMCIVCSGPTKNSRMA